IRGFSRLRKNSVLRLILGGAAVHRCGKWLVSGVGFSRCGETATWKVLFPQPVSPRGYSLSPANPYTKHALVKLQSRHKNGGHHRAAVLCDPRVLCASSFSSDT